jgi:site-specific DNA-methyltransferase (adenine-specific)
MPITKGMMSSNTDDWATPQKLFDELNKEFKFTLDPCATKENTKCKKFYTQEDNGLSKDWTGRVFMNPPYGRVIGEWVKKAYESVRGGSAEIVVCLLPARTDTKYFHDYIYGKSEIRFIKGRLKFNDGSSPAPFPSMICIFYGHRR